jgi:hypothetical protein
MLISLNARWERAVVVLELVPRCRKAGRSGNEADNRSQTAFLNLVVELMLGLIHKLSRVSQCIIDAIITFGCKAIR